jgi:DNA polymerase IV
MTKSKTTKAMPLVFPPLYLLEFRIPKTELYELEREIGDDHDGPLVRDIREAKVVIGRLNQRGRALHELRTRGLHTEEVVDVKTLERTEEQDEMNDRPRAKKRKVEKRKDGKEVITVDSSTESEDEPSVSLRSRKSSPQNSSSPVTKPKSPAVPRSSSPANATSSQEDLFGDTIKVVKLDWYYDSVKAGVLLPTANYLVYEGRIIEKPKEYAPRAPMIIPSRKGKGKEILERARADTPPRSQPPYRKHQYHKSGSPNSQPKSQRPQLLHESTSDYEQTADLPPLPPYLRTKYSCERPTPSTCPNEDFISQLNVIKEQRQLVDTDPKGVSYLAYSRAIAAIKAYPYTITVPQEVERLPNCGDKYVHLYREWRDSGMIQEVEDIKADERVKSLKIFFDIYDVGAKRAREFYAKGWRDLDDVIEVSISCC